MDGSAIKGAQIKIARTSSSKYKAHLTLIAHTIKEDRYFTFFLKICVSPSRIAMGWVQGIRYEELGASVSALGSPEKILCARDEVVVLPRLLPRNPLFICLVALRKPL